MPHNASSWRSFWSAICCGRCDSCGAGFVRDGRRLSGGPNLSRLRRTSRGQPDGQHRARGHQLQLRQGSGRRPILIDLRRCSASMPSPALMLKHDGSRLACKKRRCVCRKLRFERIGDAAHRPWRATRFVRCAEQAARPADPCPMNDAFSRCCNSPRKILRLDANAARQMPRHDRRTRGGSFRSASRQNNSATASRAK
jgi:hypothetical protein